uniref:ZP domain-containing protein n=1 Tax=Sphaeramia orbicularis TaxID=375764 RepID=A0A673C2G2_9TELE
MDYWYQLLSIPSWTSTTESNIFKRGQVVHLQVSANTRPDEHLFVLSCFVSASPEPHTKPKHAVIINKGCAAPLDSSHAVAQFVDSDREDVVNLALNTSFITSEFYIHCSVLVSNQSNTSGSKSCNYNFIQWEDLSGNTDVCKCCSSKCKSLSLKHFPHDATAVVSIGPLFIEYEITSSIHVADSLQSSPAETEDKIISGASFTNRFSDSSQFFSPESVVNQGQVIRLTVWLPGETKDTEHQKIDSEPEDDLTAELQQSDVESNHILDLPPLSTDQEISLNAPTNEIKAGNEQGDALPWDVNALTLFDGRPIPPHLEEAAIEEESQRKKRCEKVEALPLPGEVNIDDMEMLAQKQTEVCEERNYVQPVIRSKIQFSRSVDGSQALSYEEEVMQEEEGMGDIRNLGMHGFKKGGLLSTFLDLLR